MFGDDPLPRPRERAGRVEREAARVVRGPGGRLTLATLEGLAVWAWSHAALCVALADPRWLVHRHRIAIRPGQPPGTAGAVLLAGPVIVFRIARPRAQGVAVLHELAHALLNQLHADHDHRDVWLLTLALCYPQDEVRWTRAQHGAMSLDLMATRQTHAPRWALALRLEILQTSAYKVA